MNDNNNHNRDRDQDATDAVLPPTLIPLKRKRSPVLTQHSDDINCICGLSYDDGFSIACDDCSRWCHAACFDIMEGEVPEEFRCWECVPRPAMKVQKASPCLERKPRRASAAEEPWSLSYVHIPRDIVPHDDTRERLRRQAHHWRGITALDDDQPSRTSLRPLPSSSCSIRPPSYAVHTSTSIPSEHLIAPYKSTITPSSSYLSDPLNSYAHLGMPKPFVHLFGHPLDVALDSRITGNSARYVRNGCRPNAVLRPYLCPRSDKPQETLSFGIFALRDLKANEEVLLGWEWDDGHVVHHLPALIDNPHAFPGASPDDTNSPEKLHHIRNQMSNILHALSSTFTTCACGSQAKDCAIMQMAAFVDGGITQSAGIHLDLGPLVGARRGFRTRERVPLSGGLRGVELCDEDEVEDSTRTNVPHLGLSPASHDDVQGSKAPPLSPSTPNGHHSNDPIARKPHSPICQGSLSTSEPVRIVVDQVPSEDKMPPKMRKKWIQRESSARNSERQSEFTVYGTRVENEMDVDGPQSMPPPPIPPQAASPGTSPSTSFARLSLFSPLALNPLVSSSSLDPLLESLSQASRSGSNTSVQAAGEPPLMVDGPTLPPPPPQEEPTSQTTSEQVHMDQPDPPPPSTPEIPHAAPKVKLSLKDFAIRKRKQREEEERARNEAIGSEQPVQALSNEETVDERVPAANSEVAVGHSEADGAQGEDREGPVLQAETKEDDCIGTDVPQPVVVSRDIPPGTSSPPQATPYTRGAKQELIEPSLLYPPVIDSSPVHKNDFEFRFNSSLQSRRHQPSQEDGEISNGNPSQFSTTVAEQIHAYTPPTHPRLFKNASRSPSPSNSPIASTTRPSLLPYRAAYSPSPGPGTQPAGTATSTVAPSLSPSSLRPLPSGPRALRTVNLPLNNNNNNNNSHRSYPSSGGPFLPRGPSADRDRLDQWDRERTWQRTRVRGPGWGR